MSACPPFILAEIHPGIYLDSRRALVAPTKGWMAVADIHFGFEINRSRTGALLPDWGMDQCRKALFGLLADHKPAELILVGDIMDGAGSTEATGHLLAELQERVTKLVLIEGNHDRAALRRSRPFLQHYRLGSFCFHHGHLDIAPPSITSTSEELVTITGHAHPALSLGDGAGLRLKIPALVCQETEPGHQHWILPAFSPWAAGGVYRSEHRRLATWACSQNRIWQLA